MGSLETAYDTDKNVVISGMCRLKGDENVVISGIHTQGEPLV